MRACAKGVWVQQTLASMLLTNRTAAAILRSFGCVAATDVTGFGFIGHLLEMLKHNGQDHEIEHAEPQDLYCSLDGTCSAPEQTQSKNSCSVVINMKRVPVLAGAVQCIEQGVLSSLQPEVVFRWWVVSSTYSASTESSKCSCCWKCICLSKRPSVFTSI
jgi:selenide,water dikinase